MKTCAKCGDTKPTTEFSKNSSKRDGLTHWCKSCNSAAYAAWAAANMERKKVANAAWHAVNREKVNARSSAWHAANPEKKKVWNARRYAANPEKFRERTAKWAAANPGRKKAYDAAWAKANPESCRARNQNRRARKLAAGGTLSKGLSERLFRLQKGTCACGCKQPLGVGYHMDHIMPLALGGANEDWNIQLLRQRCNNQKRAKHPIDFMQQRGFLL